MHLDRRHFLATGAAGLAASCSGGNGSSRDITFIIPYAPGGGFDSYARAVIPSFQDHIGARVIPQNVDGAAGAQAVQQLYRARPDGTTIAVLNIPGAMILKAQGGLAIDLERLTWIANMGRDSYVLVVPTQSPVRSLDDLRTLGRKRLVKFTCVGAGGTAYSATKIGSRLLGIPSQIITGYKGTNDYIIAAARGDGDAAIASLASVASYMKAKVIRPLCTFEKSGSFPGLPNATTLGVPELTEIAQFRPIAGPPGMPAAIVERYSKAVVAALGTPSVMAWAAKNFASVTPDGAAETVRIVAAQEQFVSRWKTELTAT